MSWADLIQFGIEHEICPGSTEVSDVVDDVRSGARVMTLRCTGCGASRSSALGPELSARPVDPTYMQTPEGMAEFLDAVEKRPGVKRIIELVIAQSRRPETRH